MRLTIFGATGGTGREVLRQTLAAGHDVTALVRRPADLDVTDDRLTIVRGDVLDPAAVDAVVAGQEAIFVSLGLGASGSADEVVTVCTDGVRQVLQSMARHGVPRMIAMSTHGVGDSDDGSPYVRMLWSRLSERLKDKESMEQIIRESAVDWMILRAPVISAEPPRGEYTLGENVVIDEESRISRVNIGRFVLTELVRPQHLRRALTIHE